MRLEFCLAFALSVFFVFVSPVRVLRETQIWRVFFVYTMVPNRRVTAVNGPLRSGQGWSGTVASTVFGVFLTDAFEGQWIDGSGRSLERV